jgi:hypothetical protein
MEPMMGMEEGKDKTEKESTAGKQQIYTFSVDLSLRFTARM